MGFLHVDFLALVLQTKLTMVVYLEWYMSLTYFITGLLIISNRLHSGRLVTSFGKVSIVIFNE